MCEINLKCRKAQMSMRKPKADRAPILNRKMRQRKPAP